MKRKGEIKYYHIRSIFIQEGANIIMEDTEMGDLAKSLQTEGYKENVKNESRGILTWEKDLVFTAGIRGYAIDFDAEAKEGCIPY